jgi:hypothetical protein
VKLALGLVLALAVLGLPLAASAQEVLFTNDDGTFTSDGNTVGTSTLSLGAGGKGASVLTGISGLAGFGIPNNSVTFNTGTGTCTPACLGSLTLTTGTLMSGSLLTASAGSPATFNAGGSFMVSYTDGVSFTGTFEANAAWISTGKNTWTFSGSIMDGMLTVGGNTYMITQAATVQLTTTGAAPVITKNSKGVITGITFKDSGGTTNFMAPVPEPGTLTLFGSGLIGVGLFTRKRLRSSGRTSSSEV